MIRDENEQQQKIQTNGSDEWGKLKWKKDKLINVIRKDLMTQNQMQFANILRALMLDSV